MKLIKYGTVRCCVINLDLETQNRVPELDCTMQSQTQHIYIYIQYIALTVYNNAKIVSKIKFRLINLFS